MVTNRYSWMLLMAVLPSGLQTCKAQPEARKDTSPQCVFLPPMRALFDDLKCKLDLSLIRSQLKF